MLVSRPGFERVCAMTTDDLSAPLGQGKPRLERRAPPIKGPHVIAVALSLPVLAFAGWAMIADDPFGGEPVAVVPAALRVDNAEATPSPPAVQPAVPGNSERPARRDGPSIDGAQPLAPAAPAGTRT